MKSALFLALVFSLATGGASAQVLQGAPQLAPPPPAYTPPVRVEPAPVPKLDTLPSRSYPPPARPSFGDRVTNCLQEGAAAGLGPNDRRAYSGACANRD